MDNKKYSDIVSQAEQAVRGVSDPELRRVAFDKILTALLEKPGPMEVHKKTKVIKDAPSLKKSKVRPAGPRSYIYELVDEGFFAEPKSLPQVKAELENRGHHIATTSLSGPLQALCQAKKLRRQKTQAPGKGGKERQAFTYSNW